MAAPRKVGRKAFEEFDGERWNAMNDLLALSELEELTPTQRKAHLAYWYMSEVYNGGHWQYFCNKAQYDHREVVDSLRDVGAFEQADILMKAIERLPEGLRCPESVEEFIAGYDDVDMKDLDSAFAKCAKRVEDCLEEYLNRHEGEFIEWIP